MSTKTLNSSNDFAQAAKKNKGIALPFTKGQVGMVCYLLFVLVPIYWLLNMSFKTNQEILGGLSLFPQNFTLDNYRVIFIDPTWYNGYLNSIYYVSLNTIISLVVALPAAYAFSRYKFVGDKHLFFLVTD